jgi:hypothetical protein
MFWDTTGGLHVDGAWGRNAAKVGAGAGQEAEVGDGAGGEWGRAGGWHVDGAWRGSAAKEGVREGVGAHGCRGMVWFNTTITTQPP